MINVIEEKINDLIQLDVDAGFAYDQVLKNVNVPETYNRLTEFRGDHQRHVKELSDYLVKLGGKPIKHTQDFKGYVIEGMTALRGLMGIEGALKAMIQNEEIINKKYKEALECEEFDEELLTLIDKNYEDEKRHLEYIKQKVEALQKVPAE